MSVVLCEVNKNNAGTIVCVTGMSNAMKRNWTKQYKIGESKQTFNRNANDLMTNTIRLVYMYVYVTSEFLQTTVFVGGYEQTLHNFDCVCKKLGIPSTTGTLYIDTDLSLWECNLAFFYINAGGLSLRVSIQKSGTIYCREKKRKWTRLMVITIITARDDKGTLTGFLFYTCLSFNNGT